METQKQKRICLWSGPRNISTALMYSFAQRSDTVVYDEPLYAHYLSNSLRKKYHPGNEEIIQSMENDGSKVLRMMLGSHPKQVAFFKQMTHHLINLDYSFLSEVTNVILTRDPQDMLPSYSKQVADPIMADVGYALHHKLVIHFKEKQIPYVVLDSRSVLEDPEAKLTKLCDVLEIPFEHSMLKWHAGPRPEDGVWAKYWYTSVHKSTGFQAYKPKSEAFPEKLKPLLQECKPLYEALLKEAL